MIPSYNISTPRVYQSHTNMIFTNTLISCFTIFDPSNSSSQPLAAQKSSWLQVVMRGSWFEDSLTTNTPGKHGVFQMDLYRVIDPPIW